MFLVYYAHYSLWTVFFTTSCSIATLIYTIFLKTYLEHFAAENNEASGGVVSPLTDYSPSSALLPADQLARQDASLGDVPQANKRPEEGNT